MNIRTCSMVYHEPHSWYLTTKVIVADIEVPKLYILQGCDILTQGLIGLIRILIPISCNLFSGRSPKNSKVKRAWLGAMGDRPGSPSLGVMGDRPEVLPGCA
jgi:hypothetical protein